MVKYNLKLFQKNSKKNEISVIFYHLFACLMAADDDVVACNCDHCNEDKVAAESNDDEETNADNRTICGRDRDENDRSFQTVCHMDCHNRCTRFNVIARKLDDGTTENIASAYRSSTSHENK